MSVDDLVPSSEAADDALYSLALFRQMQQIADIGVWELDLATNSVTWSEQVYRIHGQSLSHDVNLANAINYYTPGSRTILNHALQRARTHGESADLDLQLIQSSGKRIWVHVIINAFSDEGKITKLYGTIQNIENYKQTQFALEESIAVQKLLNEQLRYFTTYDAKTAINKSLEATAEYLGDSADRVNLGLFGETIPNYTMDYCWIRPGISSNWQHFDYDNPDTFRWLWQQLQPGEPIVIYTDMLPIEAERFKIGLEGEGTRSIACIPLVSGDKPIGTLTVDAVRSQYHWSAQELHILQMIADVIVNGLQRSHAENALQQSEIRFDELYKNTPIPSNIWRYDDGDFVLIDYNKAADMQANDRVLDFLGQRATTLFQDFPDIIADFHLCYEQQQVVRQERLYRYPSGEDALLQITYVYVHPDLVLTYYEDVAEQRKNEQTVRYHAWLLQNIHDAVVSVNLDYEVVSWNHGAEKLYGWQADEVMGKRVADIFQPEPVEGEPDAILEAFRSTGFWQGEYWHTCKDGKRICIYTNTTLLKNDRGETIGSVAVNRDVTLQRQAEQQRIDLAVAQEKNAMLTEFLGNMSHDLRTPLSVINTSLYLLQSYDDPAKRQQKVDTIQTQARLLDRMIQDVLTMSRLEQNPPINFRSHRLDVIIKSILEELRAKAEEKNQSIEWICDAEAPLEVQAYDVDLRRAFINLIDNAIKYTGENGSIKVYVHEESDDAVIEVQDNGIGIHEEDLPLIFDRFYRVAKYRDTGDGSAGLGLAIVKMIIEQHKGSIDVRSTLNEGSTFTVYLPLSPQLSR